MILIFIMTIVLFLLLPVSVFLTWYYYKQDKAQRSKKRLFYLGTTMSIFTFPATDVAINSNNNFFYEYMIIADRFLNQPEMVYLIAVIIVYTILSIAIFRKTFLQRMNYWFKKLILYKPKSTDYPQTINNLPLIAIFILSIVIVQVTGIDNYTKLITCVVGNFLKNLIFEFFAIPLIFNFLLYFLFQGTLKFIKFLDKRESKQ